jgi:hypothetical protein
MIAGLGEEGKEFDQYGERSDDRPPASIQTA